MSFSTQTLYVRSSQNKNHMTIPLKKSASGQAGPWVLFFFFLLGSQLVGCNQEQQAPPPPPPPEVTTAYPFMKQVVEWDPYTGRLDAVEFVEVRARVSGYLQEISFEEGHPVEKDQTLFVIDQRPFKAALKQANAQLTESKAQLEEAKAAKVQAEAEQRRSQAQLELAQSTLNRTRRLIQQNVLTEDELDQAVSEFDQAQANREFAAASVVSSNADIETAQAHIEVANAAIETAQLDLEYTTVKAPISGLISNIDVTRGNLIAGGSPNSTLLTTIVSLDPIHCYFDANEQELLKYVRLAEKGSRGSSRFVKNPVFLELVDEENFPHQGHMDFVDNRVDPNTGTIRGRAIFRNPKGLLQPGLFARIALPGSSPFEATLVPDAAISIDQGERYLYVVKDGVAHRRAIKTGTRIDGLRVVHEGLERDEQFVFKGLQRVRDQAPVNATLYAEEGQKEGDGIIDDLLVPDGLPDYYEPVPEDEWIRRDADFPPPLSLRQDDEASPRLSTMNQPNFGGEGSK